MYNDEVEEDSFKMDGDEPFDMPDMPDDKTDFGLDEEDPDKDS